MAMYDPTGNITNVWIYVSVIISAVRVLTHCPSTSALILVSVVHFPGQADLLPICTEMSASLERFSSVRANLNNECVPLCSFPYQPREMGLALHFSYAPVEMLPTNLDWELHGACQTTLLMSGIHGLRIISSIVLRGSTCKDTVAFSQAREERGIHKGTAVASMVLIHCSR